MSLLPISRYKYFLFQRKFLKFQLSEVTFPLTEGRRPKYKYRANNNSRSVLFEIKVLQVGNGYI